MTDVDRDSRPWRRLFCGAVAATYLAIFACAAWAGWGPTWSALGVRPMSLPFGDIRAFTGANISLARGLDPLVDNPGDPWGRPANAPRIWLTFVRALRLRPEDTLVVGAVLFAAFLAAMAIASRLIESPGDAALMYLFAVLPASLMSIERGKIDSIVLLVVCLGIVSAGSPVVRVVALTAAAVLKLFPIFGVPAAMVAGRRRGWIAGLVALAFFTALAWATRADLAIVQAAVPIDAIGAYGVPSLGLAISQASHGRIGASLGLALARAIAALAVAAGAAFAAWTIVRDRPSIPARDGSAPRGDAFAIAASIYGGTFLISANYDYRLVFLVPAVPFLNRARQSRSPRVACFGLAALVSLAVSMIETPLTSTLHRVGTMVNIGAKVILLAALACGLSLWLWDRWSMSAEPR